MDRLRDNLHMCFGFSPMNELFPIRAQKFPSIFSSVSINWFLPWPEEALIAVASAFLGSYNLDATDANRSKLYALMGNMQAMVRDTALLYFARMRRNVYVTPKTFLCFIDFYKQLYGVKYENINTDEKAINSGLEKLADAATDVEKMKVEINALMKTVKIEQDKTEKLVAVVNVDKAKAQKTEAEVMVTADECNANVCIAHYKSTTNH